MQRQETHMAEGVVYEGIGRPKAGPVEWVKQKLAARYTEKGRIKQEISKIEKVMGPLSDEQKQQAAEKMHLEGKIKNKVVFTVVRDAVAGTVAVATAVYLGRRPDVRGNIASFMSRNTKAAGVMVSENLNVGIAKLQPLGTEKQGAFKKLLSSMMMGVDNVVVGTTGKAGELLDKAAQASVRSTTGRVINAEKTAAALAAKFKGVAADKIPKSVGKAAENIKKWELREAAVKTTADLNKNLDYHSIAETREVVQQYRDFGLGIAVDENRLTRPFEAAKLAIASVFKKSGEQPFVDAVNSARTAFDAANNAPTPDASTIQKAREALNQALLNRQAAGDLAAKAEEAKKIAEAAKQAKDAANLAKKIKATPVQTKAP